jgi:GGDEF domain-containing protein
MGNKKAYADFLGRPKQGVHIRMDGNDFGAINKLHGFETGNQAITAMGGAIREAMDEAVGAKHGKVFRIGGDEFHAFVPSHDHAAQFARAVRQKLEAIPAVGGTHNLSLSMGFGHTPDHAELAMINAKGAKKESYYPVGQAKTHAASQVPGFEGHIPLGPDQLNLKPIPQIHPETAAAAIQHVQPDLPKPVSPGPLAPKPAAPKPTT